LRSRAEEKAGRNLGSLRVLNSYWISEDATYKYYEVIMVDPNHNVVRNDPKVNWICKPVHKHRELKGMTSSSRKSRGLRAKGSGANKLRPSKHSVWKRNNTVSLRRYR